MTTFTFSGSGELTQTIVNNNLGSCSIYINFYINIIYHRHT
jgi:hypothetical protein